MGSLVDYKEQLQALSRTLRHTQVCPTPQRRIVRPSQPLKTPTDRVQRYAQCKVCYKKVVDLCDMVQVEGGGTQGHKSFWMCKTHL